MPVPKACQPIEDSIAAATKQLEDIQSSPDYIVHGKPNPAMLKEAEAVEHQIAQLTEELDACLKKHGVDPTVIAKFAGTARLESAEGSGHDKFDISLQFLEPDHAHFFVDEFPPMHISVGGHSVTITQSGGGNGHFVPKTGHMELQIDLVVDAPSPGGHMDLGITLKSDKPKGSNMTKAGAVTISGTGTGHGHGIGFPDRVEVTLTADGTVHPHP